MLSALSWLALEVKDPTVASEFYGDRLRLQELEAGALPVAFARNGTVAAFAAGDTALALRRPDALPRGGLHTHYAMSIPADEYDDWWAELDAEFDLDEHVFGDAKSLYCYDPDGNCVELGQQSVEGPGVDGVFEVVLEVADRRAAEAFYADLGFETVDRGGGGRERVRTHGPMALELWEPHLGLADARGGVHVDLGFATDDPDAAADAVADRVRDRDSLDGAVRVRDPDGHALTFHEP